MEHLHSEVEVGPNRVIEVELNGQANVLVMDGSNYRAYCAGRAHRYYGGHAKVSPFRVRPPSPGHWHVAIDLGGGRGSVKASVSVR